jgi:hypothetical protein
MFAIEPLRGRNTFSGAVGFKFWRIWFVIAVM